MNEENVSNLPPLPTREEVEAMQAAQWAEREAELMAQDFLKDDEWFGTPVIYVDFTKHYTKPNFLLSWNGRPFARCGDVQIISGQAGHGKSMLISQIITAVLNGEYGRLRYELTDSVPNPKVLLIDTEQSENDVIAGKNRVAELCGWGMTEKREDFFIVSLRDTDTPLDRWKATLQAIYEVKPTLIVLDGLLDVVRDFNEQVECAAIIYKCMRTASHYNASMLCVLHQNPFSQKLTGHLGSAAMRKVTDILTVEKDRTSGEAIFKVSQAKARGHQDIEDWKFRVLPVSLWGMPEQLGETTDIDRIEDIRKWLQDGQNLVEWPATVSDLKRIFKACGGIGSSDRQQRDVEAAKNRRFIIEQPREEWEAKQKHPKYYLNIDEV